jgi:hypothetical protein
MLRAEAFLRVGVRRNLSCCLFLWRFMGAHGRRSAMIRGPRDARGAGQAETPHARSSVVLGPTVPSGQVGSYRLRGLGREQIINDSLAGC